MDWDVASRGLPTGMARLAENLRTVQALKPVPHTMSARRPRPARLGDLPPWLSALAALATLQAGLACGALLAPASVLPHGLSWLLIVTSGAFLAAALFLLHGSVSDRRALWLAAFFLCLGSAPSMPVLDWLAETGIAGAWVRALLPEALLPLLLFAFVREFPQVVHLRRSTALVTVGLGVSAVAGGVLFVANALLRVWPATFAETALARLARAGPVYWPIVLGLTLIALALAAVRIAEAAGDERRRASLLLGTVVLGCAPGFVLILLESLVPAVDRLTDRPLARFYSDLVVYLPLLAIPAGAVHAIRAHHVLGVRGELHRALQQAIVARAGRALLLIPLVLLTGHGVLHRHATLEQLVAQQPAPALLACAVIGGMLLVLRPLLLGVLAPPPGGRDAQAILAQFCRNVASARTSREVLALLADHVERGFDIARCVLLERGPGASSFAPVGAYSRALEAHGALAALAAADPSPLAVDPADPGSLFAWLPPADQEWVLDSSVALVVPIAGLDGLPIALAGLPPHASGAAHDEAILAALASSAALALQGCERSWPAQGPLADRESPAGECAGCGLVTTLDRERCACGERLAPAVIPVELNGRFRVEAVLGRGGMGVVYRGLDLGLERTVALKTLPRAGAEALVRLRREAQSMARFVHPNLALIFGSESWRGVPVLVVEYLAGGTLAQRSGAPVLAVMEWGVALATALEAMHRKGLLHRDVKPSNIGFTDEGTPKLLDFGLARLVEEIGESAPGRAPRPAERGAAITQSHHVMGTPRYLSPEALDGAEPTPEQDLWALFVVMWEAIAGAHPFGESFAAPGERLAALRPDCPAAVVQIFDSALDPRRKRRIATAAGARERLAEALQALQ